MKKKYLCKGISALLIFLLIICVVACDNNTPDSQETSTESSEQIEETQPQTNDPVETEDPTLSVESPKNVVVGHSWDEFHQKVNNANLNTTNPQSYDMFNLAIEIEGYTVRGVILEEYLSDLSKEDWDLIVYWDPDGVPQSTKTQVHMQILMISVGVNVISATPGYTLINAEKNVYEKDFGTGTMGVVCIISENIFTRIAIPIDCPNYEQVRDSILEYVYQIQDIVNE